MMEMIGSLPIGRIGLIAGDGFSPAMVDHIVASANQEGGQ
jgi:hypothetical protein